jgi:hypothetical protein
MDLNGYTMGILTSLEDGRPGLAGAADGIHLLPAGHLMVCRLRSL